MEVPDEDLSAIKALYETLKVDLRDIHSDKYRYKLARIADKIALDLLDRNIDQIKDYIASERIAIWRKHVDESLLVVERSLVPRHSFEDSTYENLRKLRAAFDGLGPKMERKDLTAIDDLGMMLKELEFVGDEIERKRNRNAIENSKFVAKVGVPIAIFASTMAIWFVSDPLGVIAFVWILNMAVPAFAYLLTKAAHRIVNVIGAAGATISSILSILSLIVAVMPPVTLLLIYTAVTLVLVVGTLAIIWLRRFK